jgi:hypothetical protein
MCVCVHIYIHIDRERERERENRIIIVGWVCLRGLQEGERGKENDKE